MVGSLGLGDRNRSEVVSHLDGNGKVLAMAKWIQDTTRVLGSLGIIYFQKVKKSNNRRFKSFGPVPEGAVVGATFCMRLQVISEALSTVFLPASVDSRTDLA